MVSRAWRYPIRWPLSEIGLSRVAVVSRVWRYLIRWLLSEIGLSFVAVASRVWRYPIRWLLSESWLSMGVVTSWRWMFPVRWNLSERMHSRVSNGLFTAVLLMVAPGEPIERLALTDSKAFNIKSTLHRVLLFLRLLHQHRACCAAYTAQNGGEDGDDYLEPFSSFLRVDIFFFVFQNWIRVLNTD